MCLFSRVDLVCYFLGARIHDLDKYRCLLSELPGPAHCVGPGALPLDCAFGIVMLRMFFPKVD